MSHASRSRGAKWRATFAHRATRDDRLSWRRVANAFGRRLLAQRREVMAVEARERLRTQEEVTRAWREASQLVEQARRADRAASFFAGLLVGVALTSLAWVITAVLCR